MRGTLLQGEMLVKINGGADASGSFPVQRVALIDAPRDSLSITALVKLF
jgi:hypothetical protein